jgi:hypothetical protein
MVRKLPAYMTEILLGKGVKWNKQTNNSHSDVALYFVEKNMSSQFLIALREKIVMSRHYLSNDVICKRWNW